MFSRIFPKLARIGNSLLVPLRYPFGRYDLGTTFPVPRVEIQFKMESSVIIVLRKFQHGDRDTKDILKESAHAVPPQTRA